MSRQTPTRQSCIVGARAVLDQARRRIAAEYAAGRLSPADAALYEQLLLQAHRRSAA